MLGSSTTCFGQNNGDFNHPPAVLPIYGIAPAESASLTAGFRPSNGANRNRGAPKRNRRPGRPSAKIALENLWFGEEKINK